VAPRGRNIPQVLLWVVRVHVVMCVIRVIVESNYTLAAEDPKQHKEETPGDHGRLRAAGDHGRPRATGDHRRPRETTGDHARPATKKGSAPTITPSETIYIGPLQTILRNVVYIPSMLSSVIHN